MSPETASQILALIAAQDGLCYRCRRRDVTDGEIGWVVRDDYTGEKIGVLCDWCGWGVARDLADRGRLIIGGSYSDRLVRSGDMDIADGHTPWRRPDAPPEHPI